MTYYDPPEMIGPDADHIREPCDRQREGAPSPERENPSWFSQPILSGGRPPALLVRRAPFQPAGDQDNDPHKAQEMESNLRAVIEALDYLEADVEPIVPLVAIDLRWVSMRLRNLVAKRTRYAPSPTDGDDRHRPLDGTG